MVWYPKDELIVYIHDEQIKSYGGRMDLHRDPSVLTMVLKETREYEGNIYQKAAYLLKAIITAYVFEDGQHRTGYVTTKMFLRENGLRLHCRNYVEARTFLKRIHEYNIDEIAEWLRYGNPRGETHRRGNNERG